MDRYTMRGVRPVYEWGATDPGVEELVAVLTRAGQSYSRSPARFRELPGAAVRTMARTIVDLGGGPLGHWVWEDGSMSIQVGPSPVAVLYRGAASYRDRLGRLVARVVGGAAATRRVDPMRGHLLYWGMDPRVAPHIHAAALVRPVLSLPWRHVAPGLAGEGVTDALRIDPLDPGAWCAWIDLCADAGQRWAQAMGLAALRIVAPGLAGEIRAAT